MAEVSLQIIGRTYPVTCRDGDEPHLQHLAELVEAKAQVARRAVGEVSETRNLLLAALMLADELAEAKTGAPSHDLAPALERLADRVEAVAARLENSGAAS